MVNIETKSFAALIDELCTASQKCFHAQDRIMDKSLPDAVRLAAAETAQISNAKRCELMSAIDVRMGDKAAPKKTYA